MVIHCLETDRGHSACGGAAPTVTICQEINHENTSMAATDSTQTLTMTYGDRLQQALDHAMQTRRSLADAINVTPQAIGMVLTRAGNKERHLSMESHANAAKFLGVNAGWLAAGDGEMALSANQSKDGDPTDSQRLNALTPTAIELASLYDMLKDRIDRAMAYNEATAAILKYLKEKNATN